MKNARRVVALVLAFIMTFSLMAVPGFSITATASNGPVNLVVNGDFSDGDTGWINNWGGSVVPNTGPSSYANMYNLDYARGRMRSDIISITEPGTYRLSAWAIDNGAAIRPVDNPAAYWLTVQLFLAHTAHNGDTGGDADWVWQWEPDWRGSSRVPASVVDFEGATNWVQLSSEFELTAEVLALYNYQFRVIFRSEANEAPFNITGISLVRVDGNNGPSVDKAALAAAIASATARVRSTYTASSWVPFGTALASAQDVYNDANATQVAVDAIVGVLETAADNLLVNLLTNGDFSNGSSGWTISWNGDAVPAVGLDGAHTPDNMGVIFSGHNGWASDTITLTQGRYRLSAWGRQGTAGQGQAILFLTHSTGLGRNEADNSWMWDANGPLYWVNDQQLRDSAIMTSVVDFTHTDQWVYQYTDFDITDRFIEVYDNGVFRVGFRGWGSDGINLTGISLVRLDDNNQTVDKAALGAAITAALGRQQSNYTPSSWSILESALQNAQNVFVNDSATQNEVNTAASTLQTAMTNLVPIGGGTQPTNNLIPNGWFDNNMDYWGGSTWALSIQNNSGPSGHEFMARTGADGWNRFVGDTITIDIPGTYRLSAWGRDVGFVGRIPEPQTNSQVFLTRANHDGASGQDHDGGWTSNPLNVGNSRVVPSVLDFTEEPDWVHLSRDFELTEDILAQYNNTFRAAFRSELAGAFYVASITLIRLCDECGEEAGTCDCLDWAQLRAVIQVAEAIVAESLYTPTTWATLQQALTHARYVLNNQSMTQTDVDNAASDLQSAINGLVQIPIEDFRAALGVLLAQVAGYNQVEFTTATWNIFHAARSDAQSAYDNTNATIQQLIDAYSRLVTARSNLLRIQDSGMLFNGDFSNGTEGWGGSTWALSVGQNTGRNQLNQSVYRAHVTPGHHRMYSDVIYLTEPGWYFLGGWGVSAADAVNAHLFLTNGESNGAAENDRDWIWTYQPENRGTARVPASIVDFSGTTTWVYGYRAFELTADDLDVYNNRFKVVFRTEANTGPLQITGIRLERACDDCLYAPCLCDANVDKSELALTIADAESRVEPALYTPESWAAMQTVLAFARVVYVYPFANQGIIGEVTDDLKAAIVALVPVSANDARDQLGALITYVQGFNQASYSTLTWPIIVEALADAQDVYDYNDSTIPDLVDAYNMLRAAIGRLRPAQSYPLLLNGDFSEGVEGRARWNSTALWNLTSSANDGLSAINTSPTMGNIVQGWNRFTSDVINITEPGWYSLSAWGRAPGSSPGAGFHVFLTYEYHNGAPENDSDWRWQQPYVNWEVPNMGGPQGSRVVPSIIDFSGEHQWLQQAAVFEITEALINAHNGRFRVAFRVEGNSGTMNLTGMRLTLVCEDCKMDPCLCDEDICKDALALAIAEAETFTNEILFVPTTWLALQDALGTARAVYANQFVTQSMIDYAEEALLDAIDLLTPRTISDLREMLSALIADALLLNENDYREGTWNIFFGTRTAAQAVYGNNTATEIMLANAYLNLRAGIAQLVELPPEVIEGDEFFDDGFSRVHPPSISGWVNDWRGTIHPLDIPEMPADHYMVVADQHAVMLKPVSLQANVRYRFSAWVRGGAGTNVSGVFITPTLGTPITGGQHATLCHDTWCGCEAHRLASIFATNVPDWELRYEDFILEADFEGQVMIRSWPGGPLHINDIRITAMETFDAYGVTFGVVGTGGTLTAAIGAHAIQHGAAVRSGTSVTFTATPDLGFTIDRWVVNTTEINGDNRTFTTTVTADTDVRVYFRPAEGVVLTHSVVGNGTMVARANGRTGINSGTIVPSGSGISQGFSLAFFVTPDAGYEVSHWIVNGQVVPFVGRLYTVPYLIGVGVQDSLTFDVQAVLQPVDPTGGRFDSNSSFNTTNRGQLGVNINREASHFVTAAGLNSVYTDAFIASLAPFGMIRFMNFTHTNNRYTVSNWSASEADMWGEVIALSNVLNADIWICIPANANDGYIRALAELMETHLNEHIKVYVEWGNEIWGFEPQRNVNRRMVQERSIPEDTRDIWAAHQLWWEWSDYFHFAQRTAEIAFIFREVFGDDVRPIDVNSRIRPVLTWQVIPNAFAPMLEWLSGTTQTPTHSDIRFRNPHTYLWAVGIAPYFSEPNSAVATDVDAIHRHMLNSIVGQENTLRAIINNANQAGLVGGAVTYEGGPHHVGDGNTNMLTRAAAQTHPLMTELINYYVMTMWYALGGGLYTHYRHLGPASPWGHWGVKDDVALEQFKFAAKYASMLWISQQTRGTLAPRPDVQEGEEFRNPIQNPSFEYDNPRIHWHLSQGWTIDTSGSVDGQNALQFQGSYAAQGGWFEVNNPQFVLETNSEYVFSFWHRGEAGFKVIVEGGGMEFYAITEYSDEWVEYLIPFYTANGVLFNIKIGHEWNANPGTNPEDGRLWDRDAWFDFFHIEENMINNPSFERGITGWAHGLGWIGDQNYEVTSAHAFHGNNSLRFFGPVTPDGLNSSEFTLKAGYDYRLVFYHRGSGNVNVPIEIANISLTTQQSDDWNRYEAWFNTTNMNALTDYLRLSTTGAVTASYLDNFMLFISRRPEPVACDCDDPCDCPTCDCDCDDCNEPPCDCDDPCECPDCDCDCDDCNELPPSCLGDVNRDRVVDIEDMRLILQYINGEITADDLCLVAADVDRSGTIDFIDLMWIEFIIMGFFSPQDLGCTCHECNPIDDDSARSFSPVTASGFQTLLAQGTLNNSVLASLVGNGPNSGFITPIPATDNVYLSLEMTIVGGNVNITISIDSDGAGIASGGFTLSVANDAGNTGAIAPVNGSWVNGTAISPTQLLLGMLGVQYGTTNVSAQFSRPPMPPGPPTASTIYNSYIVFGELGTVTFTIPAGFIGSAEFSLPTRNFASVTGFPPITDQHNVVVTSPPLIIATPTITTHPSDLTREVGQNATFSVTATGSPAPTFQWEIYDGGGVWLPIGGATSATLTVANVDLSMSGNEYRVVVTNAIGTVTLESDEAILTVVPATQTPQSPQPPGQGTTSPSPSPAPSPTAPPSANVTTPTTPTHPLIIPQNRTTVTIDGALGRNASVITFDLSTRPTSPYIGAAFYVDDLLAVIEAEGTIVVQIGRFSAHVTYDQLVEWDLEGVEIVTILLHSPNENVNMGAATTSVIVGQDAINTGLLDMMHNFAVLADGNVVETASPATISVNLAGLNLTPEQLIRLTGFVFDASSQDYVLLPGEFTEDGRTFTFEFDDSGIIGIMVYTHPAVLMRLVIGSLTYSLNGESMLSDVAPHIAQNRTLVPIRIIAEALDGTPRWDGENRVAYIYFDDVTLRLPMGQPLPYGLGVPVMQSGRVFVPMRYVSQLIGAGVFWDAANRAVYVFVR